MSDRTLRVVAALGAALLLVGLALTVSRSRRVPPDAFGQPSPAPSATVPVVPPAPSPTRTELADDPDTIVRDPEAAEQAGAEAVLAAGLSVAAGDWSDLGTEAWPVRERPVYVGTATVAERSEVSSDVVIAFRAEEPMDELVLRLLPASRALVDVVGPPTVTVRRGGVAAPHQIDRAGARLVVSLDPPLAVGDATLVRVLLSYQLAPRDRIGDDGGPAGFGLLASNPAVSVLGHWLPLLTGPGNDGPMVPWGDVGAFPPAVWSLQVEHGEDVLVTGASDGACPTRVGTAGCTWARGLALRDVSAVVYAADPHRAEADVGGLLVRSFGAPQAVARVTVDQALEEAVAAVELFTADLTPLAWQEFDVVAAPLSSGAAGMEFPGLVIVRDDTYGALEGGFGTYVVAHEVAHQWFHALLGNGSLTDPVVDESLAQYLSVLFYAERFGEPAAEQLDQRYITGRYDRWRAGGGAEEPPGQPLGDFAGGDSYGPLVYARGALAWLAAEDAVGREQVVEFLAGTIVRYGLDEFVTDDALVADANAFDDELGAVLERYWFDPAPVP